MNKITRTLIATAATASLAVAVIAPALVSAQQTGTINAQELFQGQQNSAVSGALGVSSAPLTVTVARIIRSFLGLVGIVAVVIVIIGGFEWMTAGGNEEKVGTAKKRILQGTIGLALILSAFSIAQFVINAMVGATTNTTSSY